MLTHTQSDLEAAILAAKRESNVTRVWFPRVKIMNEIEVAENARKLTLGWETAGKKDTVVCDACLLLKPQDIASALARSQKAGSEVGVRGECSQYR